MAEYEILIVETLERFVTVTASDVDEALDAAEAMYKNGEIVLDSSDHTDTSFSASEEDI